MMRRTNRIRRAARAERGAVLVLVAVSLPVLIGFCGLVVDVGNWFEHRRHLQTQADAGAFAAAQEFRYPGCDNDAIEAMATSYSGADYNPQVGGTPQENILREFNSARWANQTDADSPLDTSVIESPPCTAAMIDVKMTETDLPWFLKLFGSTVPFINAHARVELRKQVSARGALPLGVPDVNPRKVVAYFVDEATGATIGDPVELAAGTSAGGLVEWSNASGAPVTVPIEVPRIGVRIALSDSATSASCGAPLVDCYDAGSVNGGLVLVRGWSDATPGSGTAPQVHDVHLEGETCADGYFTATVTACDVSVSATVDFGAEPLTTTRLFVKREGANNNTAVKLTAPAAAGDEWTGGSITVPAGTEGPVGVELMYRKGCPLEPANCTGPGLTSLGVVHRTFGSSLSRSGPIKSVTLFDENGLPGANSFRRCTGCTADITVSIAITGSLRRNAEDVDDPIVTLKLPGSGSLNQKLNCDPDLSTTAEEFAYGCEPSYSVNPGVACPGGAALWDLPNDPPEFTWNCVRLDPGEEANSSAQGLNIRILGEASPAAGTCASPSNWPDYPDLPKDDPRIIQLFLTPFGTFDDSGADTSVPVIGFATFYITGWSGQGAGFSNPCPTTADGGTDDPAPAKSVVGHFIHYIDTLDPSGAGEEMCDTDGLNRCVAVITR